MRRSFVEIVLGLYIRETGRHVVYAAAHFKNSCAGYIVKDKTSHYFPSNAIIFQSGCKVSPLFVNNIYVWLKFAKMQGVLSKLVGLFQFVTLPP